MVDYFLVECPCKMVDKHRHRFSNPDAIKFVTISNSLANEDFLKKVEETGEADVKVFYYTCDYSNHECKVWIDTETGEQQDSECIDCDIDK